ncbi:MAG: hypothetical protein QOF78_4527 [Phycisphaerales bacterium]|nr:hypothetical protein [Phycisphaerales bacterium]
MYGGPSTSRHGGDKSQYPAGAEQADATEVTVLIVEDERVSRNALRKLLAASGYHSHAYECAEDALRDLGDGEMPPVALIDVDLPGMSGLDLATKLEELRPDMVKVLITAAGGDRIENFRKHHEVHYIRKPLDFSRLLRLLGNPSATPNADC